MDFFDSSSLIIAFILGLLTMLVFSRAFGSTVAARGAGGTSATDVSALHAAVKVSGEVKMCLVVNTSLGMSKGKIGAQTAHAALGAYQLAVSSQPSLVRKWERDGQTKICLKGNTTEELEQLQKHARSLNIPTYLVRDAGRTQIEAGSKTVLAVGPSRKEDVDVVCGHLKLL